MPKPRKDEKENDFISRCVEEVMKEGNSQEKALGMCYGIWNTHKKKKSKEDK